MQDWQLISSVLKSDTTRKALAFIYAMKNVSRKRLKLLFKYLNTKLLEDSGLVKLTKNGKAYRYSSSVHTPESRTLKKILTLEDTPFSFFGAFSSAKFAYRFGSVVYVDSDFDMKSFCSRFGRLFMVVRISQDVLLERYLKGYPDESAIIDKGIIIKPLPVKMAKKPRSYDMS